MLIGRRVYNRGVLSEKKIAMIKGWYQSNVTNINFKTVYSKSTLTDKVRLWGTFLIASYREGKKMIS